ncbi:kinase-like protein [Gonapodya prolifera JEL478]|uniref:mitogen-activated protein kinase kinase kinase n=1 Tax=Gonapodya prolifera (strain JEL478) TaxID=1344416 RepID=A0A138ZY77_GONPJ|nr:kinase-like protein [Gonapodya prolifera JEL478]|eukprot:KXS09421.1 kinase-like protein [Gonapodya prolifera JEL478]
MWHRILGGDPTPTPTDADAAQPPPKPSLQSLASTASSTATLVDSSVTESDAGTQQGQDAPAYHVLHLPARENRAADGPRSQIDCKQGAQLPPINPTTPTSSYLQDPLPSDLSHSSITTHDASTSSMHTLADPPSPTTPQLHKAGYLPRTAESVLTGWVAGGKKWPYLFDGVQGNIKHFDVEFGDYIGSGGYSQVFRGVWQRDVEVGIKVLALEDTWAIRAFANETLTWSLLPPHPNVIRLYGICFDAFQPYIVSPLMRNGNLREYIARFRPAGRERIRLMLDIAKGIRHLHRNGVIHCNVHQDVVVIDDQGHAQISSFGYTSGTMSRTLTAATAAFVPKDEDKFLEQCLSYPRQMVLYDSAEGDVVAFSRVCFRIWKEKGTLAMMDEDPQAPRALVELMGRCKNALKTPSGVTFDGIVEELQGVLASMLSSTHHPIDTPWLHEEDVKLLKLIGKGGYGEVFRGVWLDRTVAVKRVFRGDMGRDLYTAFASEIEIWTRLKHDNVLPLLGACLTTTFPFLVSPFMEYGTAAEYLMTVDTTTYQRVKMLLDIARGMAYLETVGLVHADLKAANVLVGKDGVGVVCDFGYSKLEDAARPRGADPSERVGTPRWMPPERLLEHTSSREGDVYAFAMTAFEIWTLERPFGDVPDARLWNRIIDGDLRPCCDDTVVPMPAPLKELIHECWHFEVEDRPMFADIVKKLEEILAVTPTEMPTLRQPRPIETVVAKEAHKRSRRDELSFNAGDKIKILGRYSGGLLFGTLTAPEKGGFFPRSALG